MAMMTRLQVVLIDSSSGKCVEWFGFRLNLEDCVLIGIGSSDKETGIVELEMAAAVVALYFWGERVRGCLVTWFGDSDGVRFFLIRCSSAIAFARRRLCDFISRLRRNLALALGLRVCQLKQTLATLPRAVANTSCSQMTLMLLDLPVA